MHSPRELSPQKRMWELFVLSWLIHITEKSCAWIPRPETVFLGIPFMTRLLPERLVPGCGRLGSAIHIDSLCGRKQAVTIQRWLIQESLSSATRVGMVPKRST